VSFQAPVPKPKAAKLHLFASLSLSLAMYDVKNQTQEFCAISNWRVLQKFVNAFQLWLKLDNNACFT
jgi:hypothetical protein